MAKNKILNTHPIIFSRLPTSACKGLDDMNEKVILHYVKFSNKAFN